ncbi:MAG TPA: ferrous iron transport protein B, partial [Steroidobacteraceae bacterium]|nr:ferrous iron transport protein B [Steroidobacteraceae bacterium]
LSLIGVPNCGKTALFNRLTGSRQKVANYPGVTVERKEGRFIGPNTGRLYRLLDLPGAYSLEPTSLDEAIARDVVLGRHATEPPPDLLVCVVDATNLRLNLRLVLDLKRLGRPMIVALNMSDLARSRGYRIDRAALERALGVPVVETVAVQPGGEKALVDAIDRQVFTRRIGRIEAPVVSAADIVATQREVRRILDEIGYRVPARLAWLTKLDALVLHPIGGPALLAIVLFLMFQAVFSWAEIPMDAIEAGVAKIGAGIGAVLPEGPLRSLLIDGVVAGVGSVLVFLPQILILFFFILVLEDSGYLPRAAFLLDRLMGKVGLSGRAFIPLLSSFACAVPGIMATRTIPSPRDRIATIMIAPLMTCSARLPVYALLIGAFIPGRAVAGVFNLKGLVLFALYVAGVLSAMLVAFVLKLTVMRGQDRPLLMELPEYRMPNLRNLALGLWERVRIFLQRVGTIILTLMVVLWFLSSFPAPPPGASGPAIEYSVAGMLGRGLQYVFAPIGFNWQISIALVPGLAAREIAVGALGTVYSMSASGDDVAGALTPIIASTWSMATALSLLAWYVFAPQCLSTLAVVKRETNSWRYPLIMAGYLFALAYVASFVTYRVALMLSGG